MAEKIGDFSMEHVVTSYSRNANGDIVSTTDWRGSGSSTTLGGAQVFGSFISAAPLSASNEKSGEIEFIGESFLENGNRLVMLHLALGRKQKRTLLENFNGR